MRAESPRRQVRHALCGDKPALIWFANQRAVEYHVTPGTAGHLDRPSCLVPPGVPVSLPLAWDWLDGVPPGDFTVRNAARLLAGADPWAAALPPPRELPEDLIAQGHTIPVARVQAMHEGKRRARAQRGSSHAGG